MKAQIAVLLMVLATVCTPLAAQDTIQISCKPAQLTFFYPLGTGYLKSAENCYHFSINILGGVTGQLKGFEAGGLFNINRYGAKGAQFAGLFNIAGAKNPDIHSANTQFAVMFNLTQKGKSTQFAGIANVGDTAHFQAATYLNIAKHAKCQLGYYVNIAQESHCQIALLVNVTKKGRFQMGLINVRDTVDGVSLGLINIVKHGGVLEAGIEAGEFVHTALTFRSGVPRLYSTLFLGYNYVDNFWAFGSGPGTSFKLKGNLGLNLELTYAVLFDKNSGLFDVMAFWRNSLLQFKSVFNYRFAKQFKTYVGPTLNILVQANDGGGWFLSPPLEVKIPYKMYNETLRNSTLNMWIGVVGGVKF